MGDGFRGSVDGGEFFFGMAGGADDEGLFLGKGGVEDGGSEGVGGEIDDGIGRGNAIR